MTRWLAVASLLALVAALAQGCGQKATPPGTDPTTVANPAGCPGTVPTDPAPCTLVGTNCYYYAGPDCTAGATCAGGTWESSFGGSCPEEIRALNAPGCPATFDALAIGSACPVTSTTCTYPEGMCGCEGCSVGSTQSGYWNCEAWPSPPGCPATPPTSGSPCSNDGLTCAYGAPCCDNIQTGPTLACTDGKWFEFGGGCDCLERACPGSDAGE